MGIIFDANQVINLNDEKGQLMVLLTHTMWLFGAKIQDKCLIFLGDFEMYILLLD